MGLSETFAKNMRALRKSRGLSQDDLGELCDLTRNHIGAIERCEHSPTLLTMEAIAKALETDVRDLLDTPKL